MVRARMSKEEGVKKAPSYFINPSRQFIPSGCTLLDLVLGGGWAEGRIANIIGDKSAGKTLLAIEAAANFALKYPKGRIMYRESEAAFDIPYAKSLGMPVHRVDFDVRLDTVEDMFEDLKRQVKIKTPGLYIVDSLDALSDREEQDRDIDKGTYGTGKSRRMSELFRRLAREVEESRITVMIISQIRDKIGAMFGRKITRTGGRAMDFYASQTIWLSHLGAINKTIGKVKRPVGLDIRAKCDKNKVGLPLRECDFTLRFAYGIDDLTSSVEWLREVGHLKDIGITDKGMSEFIRTTNNLPNGQFEDALDKVRMKVRERWQTIETTFLPKRRKYNGTAQD